MQRNFFWGETEGGPPSTQPQPLGLGLPRARNFLIFNLFKRVFRSLFNAFCSNSSHICLNYRYKFLIYTFSISCLEILGGDSLPPKSLWGETVSLFSPPLHASGLYDERMDVVCLCQTKKKRDKSLNMLSLQTVYLRKRILH